MSETLVPKELADKLEDLLGESPDRRPITINIEIDEKEFVKTLVALGFNKND